MSLLHKIWTTKNYRISFVMAIVMVIWLVSGVLSGNSDTSGEDSTKSENSLPMVKARVISAEVYSQSIPVRARTEPNRRVDVKAELGGTIVALPVEKGEYVEAGTVLCELAVEDREEVAEQAKAGLEKAELDFEGAQRLETGGFQSQSQIAQALVNLQAAKSLYRRAQIDLDNLKVRAPFNGFVDARPVELGDLVQRGEICASVLDIDPILVVGRVTENAVTHIAVGDSVSAVLSTGNQVTGEVRFVERSADDITRTFRVEATVPNIDLALFSGVSAQIDIPIGEVEAHLINSSLLILADSGELGVKILDDEDLVRFVLVELLGDSESGVWVSGLPTQTKLITLGQQYVNQGEKVDVTMETSADELVPAATP